jgi:hypothetical protein
VDKGITCSPSRIIGPEPASGSPPSLSHSLVFSAYDLRNSSGSLVILAAIRRASSRVLAELRERWKFFRIIIGCLTSALPLHLAFPMGVGDSHANYVALSDRDTCVVNIWRRKCLQVP